MKRIFSSFLIVGFLGASAQAMCTYFRLSADLLKCESASAKVADAANPYLAGQDLPEIQEAASQPLVQISCSCEYSLSGANPICDTEQTIEQSSVIGVDDVTATCRRGKSLCKDVCPSSI